jgi:hypothetical protein
MQSIITVIGNGGTTFDTITINRMAFCRMTLNRLVCLALLIIHVLLIVILLNVILPSDLYDFFAAVLIRLNFQDYSSG